MFNDIRDETLYVEVLVSNGDNERRCWVPWTKTLKIGRRIWFQNEKKVLYAIKELGTLKLPKWKIDSNTKSRYYE